MRWRETTQTQDGDTQSDQNAKKERDEVEEKLDKRRGGGDKSSLECRTSQTCSFFNTD